MRLADHLPHLRPVFSSCGHLPLPVHSALPHHQRQGTSDTVTLKSVCSLYCFIISLLYIAPRLSGDVQGETGQGDTCPSASTHTHSPHQLPPLGLRLLSRAGLWGPDDVGPLFASPCSVQDVWLQLHGSRHHGLQSHGTVGRIQPDGTPAERQDTGRGGDVPADVQDVFRWSPLTVRWCSEEDSAIRTAEHPPAGALIRNCLMSETMIRLEKYFCTFYLLLVICFQRELQYSV